MTGGRPKPGRLACSEDVRRRYVDDADLARLEAVADFSLPALLGRLGDARLRRRATPRAEAELGEFAAGLDVLVVCHGAPFVSAEVSRRRRSLTLLGELEGDRFGYRLDLAAARSARRARRRHLARLVVADGGVGARPRA